MVMGHVRSNDRTLNNDNNTDIASVWGADSLLSNNSLQGYLIHIRNDNSEQRSFRWDSTQQRVDNNHNNNNNNNNGWARLSHQMSRQLEDVWGSSG